MGSGGGGGDSRLVVVSPPVRHEIINILSIVYRYNYLLFFFLYINDFFPVTMGGHLKTICS